MRPKMERPALRRRQTAATREEILDVAMNMLSTGAQDSFSHESIAQAAGMGARTVYRHFPHRAELLQALWLRIRDTTDTKFPAREEDVIPFVRSVFHAFDEHESLVRAVLSSAAGTEVQERGGAEGRRAFAHSLSGLLAGLGATERARVIAVFVAIYSAPFWQLLKDRGGLTGPKAQEAAAWLIEVLLDALRRTKKGSADERTTRKKRL
jgi:AcrR family transcriptional regulator